MSNEHVGALIDEAVTRRYSRRQILQRGAVLGLSVPAINMVLAAASAAPAFAQAASNPFKVDPKAPLDVVIFKGGFGDEYALNVNKMYNKEFPDAKIKYQGIQRLGQQLQPRFVGGTPPDAIDNSGAGNLDTAALVAQGQLADFADLMDGPAYDTPGKKFSETLIPGSQGTGQFSGKQYALEYAYTVDSIWHSDSLFKKNGWEYPQTWDAMMAMCEKIKTAGKTAPWTYQGKYPQYMQSIFDQMVYKNGTLDAIKNIDNLEPNAWKQDSVKNTLNALYELAQKGYIMKGTEGLTHTESQAAWLQGKAVFIPCGTWLENEMKGFIPAGFDMVINPSPALAGDKLPFSAINAYAGENFIVPSKGKNVPGGKEWMRLLFSKEGARFFSQNTKSLTVVLGSADGLDLGTAFASAQAATKAAGENVFYSMYGTWYVPLWTEAKNQMGELLNNRLNPAGYMDKVQAAADKVAKDSSIPKYKR